MGRLQTAFSRPIQYRCIEIENIISSTGTKELRNVLPLILENLFGFGSETGWGLDLLSQSANPHEFEAVRRLLSPEGTLLNLIYNLNTDIYLSYEFPINCIPSPTRHVIEEGGLPVFYLNKLQSQNYGRPIIALNAFEYYLFHFAYSLVNPHWQKQGYNWNNLSDCLYPCLLDDYLNYFLPLNKNSLPPMPHVPSPVRSPVVHSSMSSMKSSSPSNTTPPKARSSHLGLLKASFMAAQKQHTQSSPVLGQGEAETWRSETLVQVLSEFWLNQNPVEVERQSVISHNAMESVLPSNNHVRLVRVLVKHIHRFVNTVPHSIVTSPYQSHLPSPLDEFKKSIIPQIIQKKLYTFLRHGFDRWPLDCSFRLMLETWLSYIQPWRYSTSSSTSTDHRDRLTGRRDSQDMSDNKTGITAIDDGSNVEIQRSIEQGITAVDDGSNVEIQRSIEQGITAVDDGSNVEIQRSIEQGITAVDDGSNVGIQRSIDQGITAIDDGSNLLNLAVHTFYQNVILFYFIEDNLLFYTVLFREFIVRVFRMDLASLKNAGMLFRVAKVCIIIEYVLSLPNLPNMLQRAERDLCSSLFRPGRVTSPHDLGGSYLSPETNLNLHTQISELEKPGFQYVLLFGVETIQDIRQVLKQVQNNKVILTSQQSISQKPVRKGFASFFDFSGMFDDKGFGDMTSSEVKKLQSYLDTITSNLCRIFEIPPPDNEMMGSFTSGVDQSSLLGQSAFFGDQGLPDCSDTEDGMQLSPLGRYQIINRLRRFDISYHGDPDLQPVRSFENGTLVRILYHFCSFINTQFRDQIFDLYEREDLIGGLAKVYLAPPIETDPSMRRSPMSKKVQQQLEMPRLSLRFLANYHILTYIGLLYLFLRFMWGFGNVGYIFFLLFCVFVYGLVKALMLPKEHVS
ncbi:hypothetical protein KUTeg_009342 [Tegillarca granosa]|uniref:Sphingomyelin phosphodiesterase 4 n=1 Tax=Tegillarca granosa TaxID=220873 RepID=A0ABQ9F3P6_TEGGR|nr:hypothetical protein KUTeg_009342 [Tegillarca granosa]